MNYTTSNFDNLPTFGTKCPKAQKAGERRTAPRRGSGAHDPGQLLQQVGKGLPQVSIIFLQRLDVVGVNPAVGVGLDRHLIKIIGAAPLQGNELPHRGKVNVEHIPIERHLPHIGPHVANTGLGHALTD